MTTTKVASPDENDEHFHDYFTKAISCGEGEKQYIQGSLGNYRVDLVEDFFPPVDREPNIIIERIEARRTNAAWIPDMNIGDHRFFDEKKEIPIGKVMEPDSSRAVACLERLFCPLLISVTSPRKRRPVGRMAYIYHHIVEDGYSLRDFTADKGIDQATADYQAKLYVNQLTFLPMEDIEDACESAVTTAVKSPVVIGEILAPKDVLLAVVAVHKWMLDAAPATNSGPDSSLLLASHVASQYRIPDSIINVTEAAVRRMGGSQLLNHLRIDVKPQYLSITCQLVADVMWRLHK